MHPIFLSHPRLIMIGLTIIRIGMGLLFIIHGALKFKNGYAELRWTGEQMKYLGITFTPLFWGVCAAISLFIGGICLTFGFATRIAAAFMAFTMLIAVIHHVSKGDSFGYISFPLSQMIVFIGLAIAGSGIYSLDYYLFSRLF